MASYPNPPSVDKEENNRFYECAFNKIVGGKIFTWNWAAFFFTVCWMLYRKMYLLAFLISLLRVGVFIGIGTWINDFQGGSFLGILFLVSYIVDWLASGMLSNYLYYKDLQRKARLDYNLIHKKPTDGFALFLGIVFIPFAYLYGFGIWLHSRWKIATLKKQMAVNPAESVMK
ncbi:DUF2628 domain-containing protein [Candidatus Odyssella acanthamoebae]|uniref:DUF2628 domain-containing protein n=1 Tax=Candidatus Odyssella acanthamoebae TaxID=91604 RepID=A0A077AU89_9PROT|nr:DUF2628 domain-containing protein [Candidatus Paracaedibacter acanthamoebae]AIK95584.1 hypothetical protein ID47_00640 [Candidatus Paracaedibacter acanthamoebae]